MTSDRRGRLADLLVTLEETLDWDFDVDDFEDRLRIQKYVFLADAFGVDPEYDYGIHLYGPYSPDLADDYYDDAFDSAYDRASPVSDFDRASFRALVAARDTDWLEYAATIKSLHERHAAAGQTGMLDTVVARVMELKDIDSETATAVYEGLLEADVLAA